MTTVIPKVIDLSQPFSTVLWPTDFWNIIPPEQCSVAQKFVREIEAYLNISRLDVSFEEEWSKFPPPEAEGLSLPQFINPVSPPFPPQ
jgi:hypothetical protein